MKHILLAVTNDLAADQRMQRICGALSRAGYRAELVGRRLPESPALPELPFKARRMRLWFRRGKLFYLEYNLRLLALLLRYRPDAIVANDLDTLAACYLASRWLRCPLIYDSHEYFTEAPELVHRKWTRAAWLQLEKWIFPRLTYAYTVSESIRKAYSDKYGVAVSLVRNLPNYRPSPAETPVKPPLLIYQGALNMGRGLELMLAALSYLPGYRLLVAGRGDLAGALPHLARDLGVSDRVTWLGHVPPAALPAWTTTARYGLSLEEDLGANYRYALPNKVFDYIQARIPVLVSDLPEMAAVVRRYEVGAFLPADQRTAEGLAAKIREMDASNCYAHWVHQAEQAAKHLCWEQEEAALLEVYALALGG